MLFGTCHHPAGRRHFEAGIDGESGRSPLCNPPAVVAVFQPTLQPHSRVPLPFAAGPAQAERSCGTLQRWRSALPDIQPASARNPLFHGLPVQVAADLDDLASCLPLRAPCDWCWSWAAGDVNVSGTGCSRGKRRQRRPLPHAGACNGGTAAFSLLGCASGCRSQLHHWSGRAANVSPAAACDEMILAAGPQRTAALQLIGRRLNC